MEAKTIVRARYTIPAVALFSVVSLLTVGEILSGTSLTFVAMMAVTFFCIGTTYNFLGGIGTFSGILFANFSLRTIVISQFAKVMLFEAADKNLEDPQLTIAVYMVFYLSAMVGVLIYGRIHINLPKPMEPETGAQTNLIYGISVVVGLVATIVFQTIIMRGDNQNKGAESMGIAFSGLLLFALVLGIDSRIRSTNGQHSFGIKAFIPWIFLMLFGFFNTSRGMFLLPNLVYGLTCFLRGYRFRRLHYVTAAVGLIAFSAVVSPFELYSRTFLADKPLQARIPLAFQVLTSLPSWEPVRTAEELGQEKGVSREAYYSRPGTGVLSRLSLIRSDSNLINVCSNGFHYGWKVFKIDFLLGVPRFLYKNKPEDDSSGYTGRLTGLNGDNIKSAEIVISPIADSFGSFGWWSVVLFPLFAFPTLFIIIEGTFDIEKPWGTVALGFFLTTFSEVTMGRFAISMIRTPLQVLFISYLVVGLARMIPTKGGH